MHLALQEERGEGTKASMVSMLTDTDFSPG